MSRFIQRPNLPGGRVECLALGQVYLPQLAPALESMGVRVLPIPQTKTLPVPVSSHADLVLLHAGGSRFIAARELRGRVDWLHGMEIDYLEYELEGEYPSDCRLNIAVVGDKVLYSPQCADRSALTSLGGIGLEVKQGYARCSTCVVSSSAVITADRGISCALGSCGADVLEISPGGIRLDGYDHGFIGGSSFKLAEDVIAFTGSLYQHPDCGRIMEFLRAHSVQAVYLTQEPIFDVGGAVLLTEK